MLQKLSARLSKTIEQKKLKHKLEQDLRAVEIELQDQSTRFASLSTQLEKERVDVEKLEGTNLATLFYSVFGSREQQLEQERQELLSVQLQYQRTKQQVAYLEREQNTLLQQLDQLADVEAEYQALLLEKEQLLHQLDQAVANKLMEYAEQIANLDSEENEINEAMIAGKNVVLGLDEVIKSLENAEGWGTWDMLGGGFLSTAIKHSRIDDAQKGVDNVQRSMSRLKRELADVQQHVELQIELGEFETFADYFLDGLIFDWVVQSKISDALARSKEAKRKISQTVDELENQKLITQNRKRDLQEKRARIIEST